MSEPAVVVEHLAKRYRIGTGGSYNRLGEALSTALRNPLRSLRREPHASDFWALDDVSLRVDEGEVVGIIGRNGAGKSTLLKILSRITRPTNGHVKVYGRVGALLEVGTGFHPELTGRENVFLNGAVLGMSRRETRRRFDEIVSFAGVEQFIDTPVKRYSSGMYVRLAFAVAAHLEPDVLVIDEVLAVGDAAFQRKCLGKIRELGRSGRTTLFVSHNMAALEMLCERGIVLQRGRVAFSGTQTEAIARYLALSQSEFEESLEARKDRVGSGAIRLTGVDFRSSEGEPVPALASGQDVEIVLHYRAENDFFAPLSLIAGLAVIDDRGVPVFLQNNRLSGDAWRTVPQSGAFICSIDRLPLQPGSYRLDVSVFDHSDPLDLVNNAAELTVVEGPFFPSSELPPREYGALLVDGRWRVENAD
jgi:lipopolysaccharide transport system ATP-binding protein